MKRNIFAIITLCLLCGYTKAQIIEPKVKFINYLLDDTLYPQHVQQLEKSGKVLLQSSLWAMSKQAYSNWKTVTMNRW